MRVDVTGERNAPVASYTNRFVRNLVLLVGALVLAQSVFFALSDATSGPVNGYLAVAGAVALYMGWARNRPSVYLTETTLGVRSLYATKTYPLDHLVAVEVHDANPGLLRQPTLFIERNGTVESLSFSAISSLPWGKGPHRLRAFASRAHELAKRSRGA